MRRKSLWFACVGIASFIAVASACGGGGDDSAPPGGDAGGDVVVPSVDGGGGDDASDAGTDASVRASMCGLPGTVRFAGGSSTTVPGGDAGTTSSLAFLKLPDGFCLHFFAHVGNPMHMQFAPGGELFVASPTTSDTFGGTGGTASIVVLADDDEDGYAEAPVTFLSSIPSTYGIAFAPGAVYYQDAEKIWKRPYAKGDRTPTDPATQVADITSYVSTLHWSKPIAVADDGTIYVGNGEDQSDDCVKPSTFRGGILSLASASGDPVAGGLRWPVDVRCAHDKCFATDEGKDFSFADLGRSRLVEIHQGDDWGFPCCSTTNRAYTGVAPPPDCSGVAREPVSFALDDDPRGFDLETGLWPSPWKGAAVVALVGAAGSYVGARVVAITVGSSGGFGPASDLLTDGGTGYAETGGMSDLVTGWDDGTVSHGRPIDAKFSPDGRLFIANEMTGDIFWIDHL